MSVCHRLVQMRRFCTISSFVKGPRELFRLTPRFSPSTEVPAPVCDKLNEIIDLSQRMHDLRLKRMELLSLPANSVQGRNKELLSLGLGAVSGALSLSFHPAFALIFIVSYRMYRKANEPTRVRLGSPEKVKEINSELSEIAARIDKLVSDVE